MTSWAIRSRTREAARGASSTSAPGRPSARASARASATRAPPAAGAQHGSLRRARGLGGAQISRRCWDCWRMGARLRRRRRRGRQAAGAGAACGPGIEVLLTDSLAAGPRPAGGSGDQPGRAWMPTGSATWSDCRTAGVRLVALFSPEHGFRGAADPGAAVASAMDSATGLPIYSLYGRSSAPTDDDARAGSTCMLVDLQDAGARYYTYLATTVEVMQAAARPGIRVVVLDRPDPIGGAGAGQRARPGVPHAGGPARPCRCATG